MPKINLKDNPSLTKERVRELFANHFTQYQIEDSPSVVATDFALVKSGFSGVAVRYIYKPDKNKIFIRFDGYSPSMAVRIFLYGLLTLLILWPKWKQMTNEIEEFIRNTPEFGAMD